MQESEIISLYTQGYSRNYIYNERYKELLRFKKQKTSYSGKSKKEIMKEVYKEVDRILINWYRENISRKKM